MSISSDPKVAAGKASPFVFHETKAKPPVQPNNDAKPAPPTSKKAKVTQQLPADVKRPKVKPVAVTIDTAAAMLEASSRTIRRWIKSGKIQSFRIGRVIRIPVSQLLLLLETRA